MLFLTARFTNERPQQTLISGMSGIINCSAEGKPDPQFSKWNRKDGSPLDKQRFTPLSNGSMRVYPVRPEDKGNYTCTIKQTRGKERITSKSQKIEVSVVGE